MIERLLKASFTKFYNIILMGRLLNRLSKDLYNIGNRDFFILLLDILLPD